MIMLRRLSESVRRFMYGRYGSDNFNLFLLGGAVCLSLLNNLLSVFFRRRAFYSLGIWPALSLLVYAMLGFAIFRLLSRNIYRRQRDIRAFMIFWARLTDRKIRYFRCPSCRQTMRVPRHRGKIKIRCPKCGTQFTRKT